MPKVVCGLSLAEWQTIVRDLRTKHRNEAVLTEEVIQRARDRIRAIDQRARDLMRVQPTTLTAADLKRYEHDLYLGLRIKPAIELSSEPPAQIDDLLRDPGHEQSEPPANDESSSPEPQKKKPWKLSDD